MTTLKRLRAAAIQLAELQHLALHDGFVASTMQLDALDAVLLRIQSGLQTDTTVTVRNWKPTPDQVWTPGMARADGRRLSAWQFFENTFASIPYAERPYCHELRQNEDMRPFYNSMCTKVSRNAARDLEPSSMEDLFPMLPEASGGRLSKGWVRYKRKPAADQGPR
jgi:hypothetical protein